MSMSEEICHTSVSSPEQPATAWLRRVRAISFSRVQALVGTLAGIVSIGGAVVSVAHVVHPRNGELVAVVQEAGSRRTVSNATIEVLTADNAVVATLAPDATGRAVRALPDGNYVVRVSSPRYAADVRRVRVLPGETVEITAVLRAGSSSPVERAVNSGVRAVRRAFHF